jgi:antitoxin component YwqK of YwqJK toxin-antitoxin module
VKRISLLLLFFTGVSFAVFSQGFTRQSYHDREKKHIKEAYQVKDTLHNILHGRYISYYLNGNVESKGNFTNNETSGIWEFFYETGKLKMRGILKQNDNYGLWEYFYESGQKSMEGNINGKNREGEWRIYYENSQIKEIGDYKNNRRVGLWKSYFEDGVLKGEINYIDDFGTHKEFYRSGKVQATGPRIGTRNVGHWKFFAEDGSLQSTGEFNGGKKTGQWVGYHPSGKIASRGHYDNDIPVGVWEYYFEDGKISSTGEYIEGKKAGYWKAMNADGTLKNEVTYDKGSGDFSEFYSSGKLKVKGKIVNDKREGKWEYFYEDGKREGECNYSNDKGTYYGYYPNGNLHTKGAIEGEMKTGIWEIYENDGKLSGYYRPYYEDRKLGKEIVDLAGKSTGAKTKHVSSAKRLTHFDARFNEFRGFIVAANPILVFAGRLPLGVEFYLQERLGHEFEFIGIRDPFFKTDLSVPPGKRFERGYAVCIRQKFYNQVKAGMWYFGQEIRFTNYGHFVNQPFSQTFGDIFTFGAIEQRIEWGPLMGYRVMKRNNAKGFTIDTFLSLNIGYRGFDVDENFAHYFEDINQSKVVTSIHFGLNFGHVFSFR